MLAQNQIVETGVDRFLDIVRSRGKVCVTDLAKELGLSPEVVIERATYLEECDLVEIEHSLFKTYITAKELSNKEIQKKSREFGSKKEILIRQAEGALSALSREEEKIKLINERYLRIKSEMGFDMDSLRKISEEANKLQESKGELERVLKNSINHLGELKLYESKLKSDLKEEYKKAKGVLIQVREKQKRMSELQKTTKALNKFSEFINKNMKVFSSVEKLDEENTRLKMELAELVKKANSINLAKGAGFIKEINNLENKFVSLDKKRQMMLNKLVEASNKKVEMVTEIV